MSDLHKLTMDANSNIMELTLEDCICPICKEILIEPVTLPCKHDMCMPCFKSNLELTSMSCPMCRMRIASWSRRATRDNGLVNEIKWQEIQRLYPDKIRRRRKREQCFTTSTATSAGDSSSNNTLLNLSLTESEDEGRLTTQNLALAEPGEIRKEYEEQLKLLQEEQQKTLLEEQRASEELIRQLAEEERTSVDFWKKQQELIEKDSLFTRATDHNTTVDGKDLSDYLTSPRSTRSGNLSKTPTLLEKILNKNRRKINADQKRRCVSASANLNGSGDNRFNETENPPPRKRGPKPKTKASSHVKTTSAIDEAVAGPSSGGGHASSTVTLSGIHTAIDRCPSSESADSISHEITHFSPIQVCPRTPPKRLPSGEFHEPPVIRSTPVNLITQPNTIASPPPLLDGMGSPIMQKRLCNLAIERQNVVDKHSKSTSTASIVDISDANPVIRRPRNALVPLTFKRNLDPSDSESNEGLNAIAMEDSRQKNVLKFNSDRRFPGKKCSEIRQKNVLKFDDKISSAAKCDHSENKALIGCWPISGSDSSKPYTVSAPNIDAKLPCVSTSSLANESSLSCEMDVIDGAAAAGPVRKKPGVAKKIPKRKVVKKKRAKKRKTATTNLDHSVISISDAVDDDSSCDDDSFAPSRRLQRRRRKCHRSAAIVSSDSEESSPETTPEERDRVIAEQLQKQFNVEAKIKANFTRFLDDGYNFRNRPAKASEKKTKVS